VKELKVSVILLATTSVSFVIWREIPARLSRFNRIGVTNTYVELHIVDTHSDAANLINCLAPGFASE
jgi:hypothetical protein